MVWPWTLTFWPKNVIRSSVSQDAPVKKVWRKSINRYWRYSGNMKIWDAFGHAVTLNFDLLTPKSNRFISARDAPVTKVWRKSVNRYWRYRGNIKLPRESRTDGQRHGRTTRKHIASAGAYRRRRLKKWRNIILQCQTSRKGTIDPEGARLLTYSTICLR